VVLAAAAMVALPFIFRRPAMQDKWQEGDPVLVVVTPHNEAIRQEFGLAFSRWHARQYGRPCKLDWRVIGGTTEIMRYLGSECIGSMRAWWERAGNQWPAAGAEWMLDRRFDPERPPDDADRAGWEQRRDFFLAFRTNDTPGAATARIDVFFGGGVYDHEKAERQGLTVPPWKTESDIPVGLFKDAEGRELIPRGSSGEVWRGKAFFGTVLSTFGICYNPERLKDLGIDEPPRRWVDLTDPRLFGQVGITDPTKSGSVAKAFEMIIQQACWETVRADGFRDADVAAWEAAIGAARLPFGQLPAGVPPAYQQSVARGWLNGLNRVRLIGANARYFTDSAGKVPIDVGMGATAAGIAIDFFGRFQSEYTRAPDGTPRMVYVTPIGGSSVSADPISLLRGAGHRELAVRFITFCLGVEGQPLWNYRPGEPGGPQRYALRRLPIRRDFYPAEDPAFEAVAHEHGTHASDDLADRTVDPYNLARAFNYQPRWSGAHFGIQRDLVRALCLDSGDELRAAWRRIQDHGGPAAQPEAMAWLLKLPQAPFPVNWSSAVTDYDSHPNRLEYMRLWTAEMRANYRRAYAIVDTTRR
jgi:ABC-type Fe3+ transport system substrate-binding protein